MRYSLILLKAHCPHADLRADLFSAVAFLAGTSGFMAFDAYDNQSASRLYRLALACAEDAGDWNHRAIILAQLGRQAFWLEDPDSTLTYIEMAQVRADRLTPGIRAMLSGVRARALARLGRTEDAISAVGHADEQFGKVTTGDAPPGLYWFTAAQHLAETGHALVDLASPKSIVEGAGRITRAIDTHGDVSRSRVLSQARLAMVHLSTGDTAAASTVGSAAVEEAESVRSHRVTILLALLRRSVEQHPARAEVAELHERVTMALPPA
ncbi:hypothetical protein DP939_40630 [Spongiactinospora rosea]|uniref:Transcriptional regulator n=1 Tax=Spongiactinospora rosea TaxID=2248750 RepID=A0A366LKG3_9ACTN|nr:hypothetical protein DP939_40630 [Spongiactinospora rosea]